MPVGIGRCSTSSSPTVLPPPLRALESGREAAEEFRESGKNYGAGDALQLVRSGH
jgi:hypothetical protein